MYRHIIDRSNLDEIVAITAENKKITRRDDLIARPMVRNDIVLFNGTRSNNEYALYVTKTGFSGDIWILDILTDYEYTEIQGIAEQMRQNAIDFPPASKLLTE